MEECRTIPPLVPSRPWPTRWAPGLFAAAPVTVRSLKPSSDKFLMTSVRYHSQTEVPYREGLSWRSIGTSIPEGICRLSPRYGVREISSGMRGPVAASGAAILLFAASSGAARPGLPAGEPRSILPCASSRASTAMQAPRTRPAMASTDPNSSIVFKASLQRYRLRLAISGPGLTTATIIDPAPSRDLCAGAQSRN